MATGDMKNNFKQLQAELKAAKYSHSIDIDGLLGGSPQAYLGIYHYLFTTYSTKFNKDISSSNNELYGKSDMRFMEAVYKILRDMFDHKPQVTREQFFSPGFAERKVIMATEILRLIRSKYKPPKSTTFKVAASREEPKASQQEKILKEPHERPRKIAHKTSPNVAGAIVLPVRAASAASGYKVPKASGSGQRLSYESQLFSSSDTHSKPGESKQFDDAEGNEVEIVDVTATSPGHSIMEPINNSLRLRDQESTDSSIKRRVVDLVSPALLKINERLGKVELNMKNLEQKESPSTTVEAPSSAALTAGLSKQMTDIVFKLETLTSKVVLLENRLIMVEARLNDEENYRKVLSSSQSYLDTRKAAGYSLSAPIMQTRVTHYDRNNYHNNDKISRTKEKDAKDGKSETSSEIGRKISSKEAMGGNDNEERDENGTDDEPTGDEGAPAQEDNELGDGKGNTMAFMKTLVNPNDPEIPLTTDDSQVETADKEGLASMSGMLDKNGIERTHTVLLSQSMTTTATPFDDLISPIRAYNGAPQFQHYQDESILSIPYGRYEMDTSDDRRSSTPTHFTLDTSTVSRVNRINMMMTETQKLFN